MTSRNFRQFLNYPPPDCHAFQCYDYTTIVKKSLTHFPLRLGRQFWTPRNTRLT